MRLAGLALFAAVAVLASPLQAALSRSSLMSILQARKDGRPQTQQDRQQQEQALYQHLKNLNVKQLTALQARMPPALLQRIVQRLKFLKQQESAKVSPGGPEGPNTVMSGASSVRRSGASSANSLNEKGKSSGSSGTGRSRAAAVARLAAAARRRMMALRRRRPKTPMDAISGYQSFTNKATRAMREGCTYPIATESVMESFVAGSGGCRMSAAVCYMKGQSCVDVGMSMMCCPLGYSSGTLRMLDQMKRMQAFMNSFM